MDQDIAYQIRQIAGTNNMVGQDTWIATVTAVDKPTRTCSVTTINAPQNMDLSDVLLMAEVGDGWLMIPSIDSTVIIGNNAQMQPYVKMFSDLSETIIITGDQGISMTTDGIQFNDGSDGGLTITPELVNQLDKNNEILSAILSTITGTPINEPGNGSPSALQAALSAVLTGKLVGDFSNIENKNITHGGSL